MTSIHEKSFYSVQNDNKKPKKFKEWLMTSLQARITHVLSGVLRRHAPAVIGRRFSKPLQSALVDSDTTVKVQNT